MATLITKRGKKIWLGQVKRNVEGTCVRRQKQFATKKAAVAWELATATELEQSSLGIGTASSNESDLTILQWAEEYMDHCIRYSKKTVAEKKLCFQRLYRATDYAGQRIVDPDMAPEAFTVGHAMRVLDSLFKAHGGGVANKARKNLTAWWYHAMKVHQVTTANPWAQTSRFPVEQGVQYTPPEADFWEVVGALDDPQDKVMILAYFYTAARRSELFRLNVEHIDFGRSTITLFSKKNREGRLVAKTLPMVPTLRDALAKHVGVRTEGPVFLNPKTGERYVVRQYWIRHASERAGVKPFGYHAIRRLAASVLADRNVPMVAIQQVLRHENLATTERYVRGLSDLGESMGELESSFRKNAVAQ